MGFCRGWCAVGWRVARWFQRAVRSTWGVVAWGACRKPVVAVPGGRGECRAGARWGRTGSWRGSTIQARLGRVRHAARQARKWPRTARARRRQAVWRRHAGGRPPSPRRIGSDLARRDGMVQASPPARPHGVWGLASLGSAWGRSGLPARRPEPRRAGLRKGWDEKRGYVARYRKIGRTDVLGR